MRWNKIEKKFEGTPYVADTLSEPDSYVRGEVGWKIFSREGDSCLGEIEERKFLNKFKHYIVKVYPTKEGEQNTERSALITILRQRHIPFSD